MALTPLIWFKTIDGSDTVCPFVKAVGMSMDRRDAGNPNDIWTDIIGIGSGQSAHQVYTFSIDWRGTDRITPGHEHSLLPNLLTGETLLQIQTKQAVLLLDDSTEACRFSEAFGTALIGLLKDKEIAHQSIFLVSQNAAFLRDLNAWLSANQFDEIASEYYSYFLATIAQHARWHFAKTDVWREHLLSGWERVFREASIQRKFICMNNMPKPHRIGVLVNLLSSGLISSGFVSFGGNEIIVPVYPEVKDLLYAASRVLDVDGERREEILKILSELHCSRGFTIDRDIPGVSRSGNITNDLNIPFFNQSFFTIHCETEFTNGLCTRITEKTFKPLVNFHPFVLFGDPGSLRLLRHLGFKTFAPLIDESYDDQPDLHKRFSLAWKETERLLTMTQIDLQNLLRRLWPVLRYNAQYAVDGIHHHLLFKHGFSIIDRIIGQFNVFSGKPSADKEPLLFDSQAPEMQDQ